MRNNVKRKITYESFDFASAFLKHSYKYLSLQTNSLESKDQKVKICIQSKSEINLWVLFNNTNFLKNTMITHLNLKIRFVEISFTSKQIISHTCSCIC